MKKKKNQVRTIKKPPLPPGKLVRTYLTMTERGFGHLEKLKKLKGCKTYGEAFHIIYSIASDQKVWANIRNLIGDIDSSPKKARTFAFNEYTLAGLRELANKYDARVDVIVEMTAMVIIAWIRLFEEKPFKNKKEVLKNIEAIMEQIYELRSRLEKTFPELGDDSTNPNNPAYHLIAIDAGLDGLYFLVRDKLFDD